MSENTIMLYNLKYLDPQRTLIQANIGNNECITIDQNNDIHNLYSRCVSGEFGEISEEYIQQLESIDPLEEYRKKLNCSLLQGKAILYQYGLLDQVENLIANSDFLVQLAWNNASVFERKSPLVEQFKSQLTWPDGSNITDEDLDRLFEEARLLKF
jgi:gamma-glutamylcyclotransferase (GGCT)/AIG2-like uncharacterized protein YtfP